MNKKLKPGEPWEPIFRVYDEDEDGVLTAKDCTGMSLVWIFKRSKLETETAITSITASWTDQSGGVGYFSLPETTTINFTSTYWHQVILYNTSTGAIVKPFDIYKLIMVPTLEKDAIS